MTHWPNLEWPAPNLPAIEHRYARALDAKPSKGDITPDGITALTDAVCDIPDLLREIRRLQGLTDSRQGRHRVPIYRSPDVEEALQELAELDGAPTGFLRAATDEAIRKHLAQAAETIMEKARGMQVIGIGAGAEDARDAEMHAFLNAELQPLTEEEE